jgi:hypothetical protein
MQKTKKLVPLYKDGDPTEQLPTFNLKALERIETERMQAQPSRSYGMGTCSWVNSMLRSSGVMLVCHTEHMGSFRVLGITQEDREWIHVRIVTKSGEGSIILPWYAKFDLFLGSP